jgi:hypothetical protein
MKQRLGFSVTLLSLNVLIECTKAGPSRDYGQRAHQDLVATRGAGFRKEKNKKKRGSYKGGEITVILGIYTPDRRY